MKQRRVAWRVGQFLTTVPVGQSPGVLFGVLGMFLSVYVHERSPDKSVEGDTGQVFRLTVGFIPRKTVL